MQDIPGQLYEMGTGGLGNLMENNMGVRPFDRRTLSTWSELEHASRTLWRWMASATEVASDSDPKNEHGGHLLLADAGRQTISISCDFALCNFKLLRSARAATLSSSSCIVTFFEAPVTR